MNPPTVYRPPTTDYRPPGTRARASRGAAFTLIELMVAAGITTLLLLGMTGIFDQAMKAWRLSSRRADAEREVRATLGMIERDLRSLWSTTNLPIYRLGTAPTTAFIGPSKNPEYSRSVALFFLTRLPPAQQPSPATNRGDICGVGYYVAWDTNGNNGRGAYHLYRYLQGSSNQLVCLTNFLATTTSLSQRTGLFPQDPAREDEIVGSHVISFRAEFKTVPPVGSAAGATIIEYPGPLVLARRGIWTLPVTANLGKAANLTNAATSTNVLGISLEQTVVNTNFPTNTALISGISYVQLELTAYGTEAVRNFSSSNDWFNSDNIRKFGRAYLWRVDL